MSMPGWYPDPSGQQGHFRYWDGASWSNETTTNPQASPAPAGGDTPFPGGGTPAPGGGRRRGGLVAALAVLLVVVLAVYWAMHRNGSSGSAAEDTNTAAPTVSAWNETSTPSPSASSSEPEPSGAAMTSCPDTGGNSVPVTGSQLEGGGLAADVISGWDESNNFSMRWAHDTESVSSTVMSNGQNAWFSVVSLSRIDKADGFTSTTQAAEGVMSCFASSSYYQNFTSRNDLMREAVTIGGKTGYRIRSEVHVNDPNFQGIQGDVVDVIVVDTGNADSFGLFVSSYTIGDTQRQPLVDACIASLRLS